MTYLSKEELLKANGGYIDPIVEDIIEDNNLYWVLKIWKIKI